MVHQRLGGHDTDATCRVSSSEAAQRQQIGITWTLMSAGAKVIEPNPMTG
jgi:hypothetical protein